MIGCGAPPHLRGKNGFDIDYYTKFFFRSYLNGEGHQSDLMDEYEYCMGVL